MQISSLKDWGPVHTLIRIFLDPQVFFPDTPSMHTYPASARESGTFWIRSLECMNIFKSDNYESGTVWTPYPCIFLSGWRNKIEPSSLPWNQFSRWLPRAPWRMLCYLCFLEESWALKWIRKRFGYVWRGKFDVNTLRVDGNILESGKKTLRIEKYPDTYRAWKPENPVLHINSIAYTRIAFLN